MSDKDTYDVCIIGAGSAGLSCASGFAQLGLRTALIERGKMGGDCLNTGCVPSKSMLAAAKAAHHVRQAQHFGLKSQNSEIDFAAVKDHVNNVIKQIEPHDSQERFEDLGVTVYRDEARFLSPHDMQVGDDKIKARYFVIAAGGHPFIPDIDGMERNKIYTNETIFDLRERPDHLVIIGGGPIGVEMAQAHARLGSRVTVIQRHAILPKDAPELTDSLIKMLQQNGVNICEDSSVTAIEHGQTYHKVTYEKDGHEKIAEGSHILLAVGRRPNTEALDLDQAGVEYNAKGLVTDERLRTSQHHIFAAGDIVGGPQFTHVAGYHAGIIIRNIAFKIPARIDYKALPWVTYTDPELAHVGETEQTAREKYGDKIKTMILSFEKNDRALAENRPDGKIKIVADKNDNILGASILTMRAGEMIGLWGLAIDQSLKVKDIAGMIMPYPTFGEMSKTVAGEWYKETLFSGPTKKLVKLLQYIPFVNP